jgi:GT2 family glycosyltransferase
MSSWHDYDIVCPTINADPDKTSTYLESIKEHSESYRLILVDNGTKCVWNLAGIPHLLVRNTENVGFVKAVNQGLSLVTAPCTVIMNDDTEAVPGWLDKLRGGITSIGTNMDDVMGYKATAMANRVVGCGPLTNADGSWQGRHKRYGTDYLMVPYECMLAFFCVMFDSRVFKEIGMLDESFGMGFGDDDDYCRRIHKAGMRIAVAQHLMIPHHHRTSFKSLFSDEEIQLQQDQNLAKFKDKHGLP